jgi:hypothetical protein
MRRERLHGTRFITAQHIMKTMACKACKNMSIFKASIFPILINHSGGVEELGVYASDFKGLISDTFYIFFAISFREGKFSS